jgi:ubiquinone/menaquinone biosynthesis C-methylase UbiE
MRYGLKEWFEKQGEDVLRRIGIKEGQTVLDFGCGSGNYAIPIAKIVGDEGTVYALDKNRHSLNELMQRARGKGLTNIKRIDASGEVKIHLDDESVDAVLLYDIFWYFTLWDPRLPKLLSEVYRVLRPNALVSVYPKHIDSEQLQDKIENAGFHLEERRYDIFIHDGSLGRDFVLNFSKKPGSRHEIESISGRM